MKKNSMIALLLVAIALPAFAQEKFSPPKTKAQLVRDSLHGITLTDNYRWLENGNDPKVIEWTKEQHDYGLAFLSQTQRIHPGLKKSIAAYLDKDYEGPLTTVGNRVFQTVKKKGDKQAKIYTLLGGSKQLIWDPVSLDTSGNLATADVAYSYDGERAAISAQSKGAEINTVYFIDTRTGKQLHQPLSNAFTFDWCRDQQYAYVTFRNQQDIDQQRPLKTYRIKVGAPIESAVFMGTTADAKDNFFIYDNRYSKASFSGKADFFSNELHLFNAGTSSSSAKLIYQSKKYSATPMAIGNRIYIKTNDKAPNGKLMLADLANPDFKHWKTLIPEASTVMDNYVVTKSNIIVLDKKDLMGRLTLYSLEGKRLRQIPLPEQGSVDAVQYDRENDQLYISLVTFTASPKTYVCSPANLNWKMFYQTKEVVDMSGITGEMKFYTSKDGTKVPAFVIAKKDIKLDGNNPVILLAYGGFQAGLRPGYYGFFAEFLRAGGIVVEAGIRGGDEYGEQWHINGMLGKKQNSFDDFYACAEWLIREKYTNPNKIVAIGASNGGLLMGAAATQRPDLFKAIVSDVPLLDMLRYDKFLIARYWIPEYGSADDKDQFNWLLRYSPYHNIRTNVGVPSMLVMSGANDTRVDPMHAKKFVAALQNNPAQTNPVVLHMDFNSGHGTGQNTQQSIENWNFIFEYIMNQLGM